MVKLTVSEIKRQIAALEAKAARLAEEEAKASVGKVRALMKQLGVTLEQLSSKVSDKVVAAKKAIASKPTKAKRAGKGVAKYRDPETGATWTGFGRAPGWIASAANRDDFLVAKRAARAPATGASVPATKKRAVAKKAAAKKVTAKKAVTKKATTPSVKRAAVKKVASKAGSTAKPKRKPSIKAAATKATAKKPAKKRAASAGAAAAPAAIDNSGTSAT